MGSKQFNKPILVSTHMLMKLHRSEIQFQYFALVYHTPATSLCHHCHHEHDKEPLLATGNDCIH